MITPITFPSALEFWLTFNTSSSQTALSDYSTFAFSSDKKSLAQTEHPVPFLTEGPSRFLSSDDKKRLLWFAEKYGLKTPIHVLVPDRNRRHLGKDFRTHILSFGLPPRSFITISNVPIIRPELCFLLAAKHLPMQELAVLATDLCATYGIDESFEFGQFTRLPTTSVESITNYLQLIQNAKGIRNAKSAIRFALDRSHSPMESKLGVTYILPLKHGGFAVPRPELNRMIPLSSAGTMHFGAPECCADIAWPEKKIIVEYDSDLVHNTMNQIRKDKRKTNALELSGYKVFHITKDCFRNYASAEVPFLTVKKELGIRTKPRYYQDALEKRRDLIRRFFLTYDAPDWIDWARSLQNF